MLKKIKLNFKDPKIIEAMKICNLNECQMTTVAGQWAEIAELLGPENCWELRNWITRRRNAIARIKEQPFYEVQK